MVNEFRNHIEELRDILEENELNLEDLLYRILFNAELSVESRNDLLSRVEYIKKRMNEGLERGNKVF
jgi:hypothetical protein